MMGLLLACLLVACQKTTAQKTENMTISLFGNPTTGYSWFCEIADESVIQLISEDYQSESDMTGAGGRFIFTFSYDQPGESEIVFVYRRPWETEEPLYQLRYLIKVDAKLGFQFVAVSGEGFEEEVPQPHFE